MNGLKEEVQWWHSLTEREQHILLRLGLKADPTIKDRLLADIAKQAQRDARRAKKMGKAEKGIS